MVCLRNICINALHKGDGIFTNNNNNNNNKFNKRAKSPDWRSVMFKDWTPEEMFLFLAWTRDFSLLPFNILFGGYKELFLWC
jgi:hypothetical protein